MSVPVRLPLLSRIVGGTDNVILTIMPLQQTHLLSGAHRLLLDVIHCIAQIVTLLCLQGHASNHVVTMKTESGSLRLTSIRYGFHLY